MTRIIATMIGLWLMAIGAARAVDVDPTVVQAEARRVAVMREASSKTVAIFPPDGQGGGSGVVISPDGYALTNYHVVHGSEKHMKCGLDDGRAYDAVTVGIDPVGDVALIKLFGRNDFPVAEFGDSDLVRVGDWVFAAGNPFLLAHDFHPSISYGIVSGVHRYQFPAGTLLEYADCLQTDAAINPGNSGGPLWNADGKLIGINGRGSFEKRGRVNVGVGYAISINQIKHFLGSLKSGRIVDHATLGARVASDADGRAVVGDVLEDSDAWRRGLRIGDEIVSFGGRPVLSANDFKNVLGIFPQGYRVPMTFRSRGVSRSTYVRLAGVHNPEELLEKMEGGKMPQEQLPPPHKPEEPDPDQPKEGKKPDDKQPAKPKFRLPFGGGDETDEDAKPPEVVTQHYQERRGYANYFYNEQERDRVWRALSSRMNLEKSSDAKGPGAWSIVGEQYTGGAPVAKTALELIVGDDRVEYRLPTGAAVLPMSDNLTAAFEPDGTGGLLAALSLWRRLVTLGPAKFGDLTYLGTFPLAGAPTIYNVLLARYAGITARFYIDQRTGDLVCVESQLDDALDPCELVFIDYREQQGRWLPGRIDVRHGDGLYAVLVPQTWNFAAEVKP